MFVARIIRTALERLNKITDCLRTVGNRSNSETVYIVNVIWECYRYAICLVINNARPVLDITELFC
jgi:hypothetical protein